MNFAVAAVVIAVPLSVASFIRNDVWTDELKLWNDVVLKSPGKGIGYNNRGAVYAERGES